MPCTARWKTFAELARRHWILPGPRQAGWTASSKSGLSPWDVAAGALLVREAGGVVTDFAGSDKVEEADSVLAAPYKLMTPLRRLIEPHWTD